MKFCRRCIYPDTKPNLWFDETGLCSACIAFDERAAIDWGARAEKFMKQFHGCRVAVACSGGKDSTFIVVKLLEMGVRPLAVCATTDDLSPIGRRNLDNIGRLCDLIEITPNRSLRRRMSRYALETVGDISWCEHVLIWTIPAQIAAERWIPFVFYGENPQNEYGAGPRESQQIASMPPNWEQEFGGMLGLRLSDMKEQFPEGDFDFYTMPTFHPRNTPQRHFLGYYFPWDGEENARIAERHGFEWNDLRVETSACCYENLDNYQTGIHDYFRYLKYGYTRATDLVCNRIRRDHMTRAGAVAYIKTVDPYPRTYLRKPIEKILAGIDMDLPEFWQIAHRFTNRELFAIPSDGPPIPKFEIV